MGYHTDFNGRFDLDKPLTEPHRAFLAAFNDTRHMKRDAAKTVLLPDPVREAVGLPVGPEGAYFVGAGGLAGQEHTGDILNYNKPPDGQPGLWCQWVPDDTGTAIEWDGGEKFYSYSDWLRYLIEHFLKPWGYTLNGEVEWRGEDWGDTGVLMARDNVVTARSR